MVFPFKEKGFPRKSLYSCVVVLPLCLLKFIHSYIEFFPTNNTSHLLLFFFFLDKLQITKFRYTLNSCIVHLRNELSNINFLLWLLLRVPGAIDV